MARRSATPDTPPKKNKIHLSLFVDGQDVTLLEEFNTPEEAIAAAREFLDGHYPAPAKGPRRKTGSKGRTAARKRR
jgi:hypothetical protein